MECLFGQSFSIAPPIQALRGLPCLGSYSVVQCIRHLMDQPLYCSAANAGVWGERLWWWLHLVRVTQQFHLASVAAWLSSTSISHHHLFPHTPSIHLSEVIRSPHCGIAPQSLNSSSQLLPLPEDQCPCLGVCMAVARTMILIPFRLPQISCLTLALSVSPLTQTIALLSGLDPCFSSPIR